MMGDFQPRVLLAITTPMQEGGGALSVRKCRAMTEESPYLVSRLYYNSKLCMIENKNSATTPFSDPVTYLLVDRISLLQYSNFLYDVDLAFIQCYKPNGKKTRKKSSDIVNMQCHLYLCQCITNIT